MDVSVDVSVSVDVEEWGEVERGLECGGVLDVVPS